MPLNRVLTIQKPWISRNWSASIGVSKNEKIYKIGTLGLDKGDSQKAFIKEAWRERPAPKQI